jgi:hypothetical protein
MERINLTITQTYVVYAKMIKKTTPWYYIADDSYSDIEFPVAYPDVFFTIIDHRTSKCWLSSQKMDGGGNETKLSTFSDWACDELFYERLVDWNRHENEIFKRYKEFMDLEFPDPLRYKPILYLDGNWCQCGRCENIWQNHPKSGMLRCPQCRSIWIDPHWADDVM